MPVIEKMSTKRSFVTQMQPLVALMRGVIERQQHDDSAYWKNAALLREKGRISRGVEIHGSALSLHGKGTVIAGKSEAGKTTTWANLLKMGGRAISEDLTNIVFHNGVRLVAPRTLHAFRMHGKYHRAIASELPSGVVGKMKSGANIPNYRPAPMDNTAQSEGRRLNTIFYISPHRLHPAAYPRVTMMSEAELVARLREEESTTFPSLFHKRETHTRESIRAMNRSEKTKIILELVQELRRNGVQFFEVFAPEQRNAEKQGITARAIYDFVRGFNTLPSNGLNLIALNRKHAGQVFNVPHNVIIGKKGDVRIGGDEAMADKHAEIKKRNGAWAITDLGTHAHVHILRKTGVEKGKLDWRRCRGTIEINHGDLIAIGRTFFQVVIK